MSVVTSLNSLKFLLGGLKDNMFIFVLIVEHALVETGKSKFSL